MPRTILTVPVVVLRPAADADIDAISAIWHQGWADGHLGHVPATLVRHRGLDDFRALVPTLIDTTTVATRGSTTVGFVAVCDDEVEQIYVDAAARGTGVATQLLTHGETVIGARHERAWLAVVAGNLRARRFYERSGWSEAGPIDHPAPTVGGATIPVPALRYEKRLSL